MNSSLFTVRGAFLLAGYQPDGDTLRFVPDDLRTLGGIRGASRLTLGKDGSIAVRLEGIDAPELHFQGWEQPHGERARDALLELVRAGGQEAPSPARTPSPALPPARVRGTLLTAIADPHGRAIAYVFPGDPPRPPQIETSANARLLAQGVAYPLAYATQPEAHRTLFREFARAARDANLGVWRADRSAAGFALRTQASIGRHGALVFPKLFRRCLPFVKEVDVARRGFRAWLAAGNAEDDVVTVRGRGRATKLSDLLEERDATMRMTADLLELVFAT